MRIAASRTKHRDIEREWKQRVEELKTGLTTARDTIQAQKIQMAKLMLGFGASYCAAVDFKSPGAEEGVGEIRHQLRPARSNSSLDDSAEPSQRQARGEVLQNNTTLEVRGTSSDC